MVSSWKNTASTGTTLIESSSNEKTNNSNTLIKHTFIKIFKPKIYLLNETLLHGFKEKCNIMYQKC